MSTAELDEVRFLIATFKSADPWVVMAKLAAIMAAQQGEIEELKQELQRAKQRHDEHVMQIRKDMERLKGTHGA